MWIVERLAHMEVRRREEEIQVKFTSEADFDPLRTSPDLAEDRATGENGRHRLGSRPGTPQAARSAAHKSTHRSGPECDRRCSWCHLRYARQILMEGTAAKQTLGTYGTTPSA